MKGFLALTTCLALNGLAQAQVTPPKLKALAAIVMDGSTGRVLYSKNSSLRLHPASTTKIMTAMLLLERCRPEEMLTAPSDIDKVKESSLHLKPMEQVSAEEMLYALMLRSANDGCHTVAVHIAGSDEEFAKLMNDKAKQIGCQNTTFVNPHGLTDENHLTTAHDLAVMAREAMKDPAFARVVGTKKHTIKRSINQGDTLLVNRDKFLSVDPRARGVKTGWTKAAGHCFVGCVSDGEMTLVTTILKSDAWLEDQKTLTNWVFDNFETTTVVSKGDLLGEVSLENAREKDSTVVANQDFKVIVPKGERPDIVLSAPVAKAPARAGAKVAVAELLLRGQSIGQMDAVLQKDVEERSSLLQSMTHPAALTGFMLLGGGTYLMRRKSKRLADRRWR